ncbi:MAG TPA: alpha/beta hydrolase [Candidatus Bathyarchaeia archaeon]|nr:alpha/beta hydrolase [Candidatus Bathyarchaeia archaeon]
MKILFLHGWHSVPGGVKPTYLIQHGHKTINPALPDEQFDEAVKVAQAEFDAHQPDAIVGSSRGGAVALEVESGDTPLVLLCPAWKRWGRTTTAKRETTILHSRKDETIPFADSQELIPISGPDEAALIETGNDHRLADAASLRAMLDA